jgi:Ca2+-binding RTX toxin-like protein
MALKGNDRDNHFNGTIFDDEIYAFGGNDDIDGSPGSDYIDGGLGTDLIVYTYFDSVVGIFESTAIDVDLQRGIQFGGWAEGDFLVDIEDIIGTLENDTIRGDGEANDFDGFTGDDTLDGRAGDDVMKGNDGNDTITGGLGQDLLQGGNHNDTLFGDPGNDRLEGGASVDMVNYLSSAAAVQVFLNAGIASGADVGADVLSGIENATGSTFADFLVGNSGANVLAGSNGNDTLAGLGGADVLSGGIGFDTANYVASTAGVIVDLTVGAGLGGDATNDTLISIENLTGSNLIDALTGNAFANILDGGGGADQLRGRAGNDVYIVDDAGDSVTEATGEGQDEVRASVSFALVAGAEVETLRTTDDNGTAAINLTGSVFANLIVGNNGNNALNGAAGADTLIGGRGVDLLTGGSEADTFVFRDVADSGTSVPVMDLIVDFDPLAGDLIDLIQIDADVFTAGNQAFTFIGAAGFSGTPGEVNFVQQNGETIIQVQTGVVADSEMSIRIAGLVTPDASWFVL